MYSLAEVETALDREPLSDALYKMERFARASNLIELADWCHCELHGYDGSEQEEIKRNRENRTVAVQWRDAYGSTVLLGPTLDRFRRLPWWGGVETIEEFKEEGGAWSWAELVVQLNAGIGTSINHGWIAPDQIQALLKRIRLEARRRLHDYVPRIPRGQEAREEVTAKPMQEDDITVYRWDVFICHVSEDKEEVARPLADLLLALGFRVWYDEQTLLLGDSLRRKIDEGLAKSRYGVVILSPSFFAKDWPQMELDGLVAREVGGKKVILPVWHRIDKDGIVAYSPILAGRLAVSTSKGLDEVARQIVEVISPSAENRIVPSIPRSRRNILKETGKASPRLRYGGDYDTDIRRDGIVFTASAGDQRLTCIIPFEDIADKFHLKGSKAEEVVRAFEANISTIMAEAQRAFDAGRFNASGQLEVRLFEV